MNYMHECDRLQSENARLRQEALIAELEIRNLRAAIRSKKCDRCGSCAVRFEPAPELPRKVEPGTELTVGATYRITEISGSSPEGSAHYAMGSELVCLNNENAIQPCWLAETVLSSAWAAWGPYGSGCTYVTGLELVQDAPAKEPSK